MASVLRGHLTCHMHPSSFFLFLGMVINVFEQTEQLKNNDILLKSLDCLTNAIETFPFNNMPEQSIEAEQMPTDSASKRNNVPAGTETPPLQSRCRFEWGIPLICGSNSSALYVEGRNPHDQDNFADSSVPASNREYRNNEQMSHVNLLSDLKEHLDNSMADLKEQSRRDFEKSK
jgi:hypothetical protein